LKKIAQLLLVFHRRGFGIFFTSHAVNVLRRNLDFAEQRFAHHSIVALRMVRPARTALVAPKKMHAAPVDALAIFRRGEERVERFRSGATRKCDGETAG